MEKTILETGSSVKTTLKLPGKKDFFTQEAFKTLRTNLQFCGQDICTVVITSCNENEGKTTITLQLAKSLAELDKRVLVIDADMRKSVKALGRYWRREAIDYILQNERYAGNALLQKRYTTDSFPRKKKRNRGEREMYFVAGSNDAIISQEMFDQAQQLRKTRKREPTPLHDTISKQILPSLHQRGGPGKQL